MKNQLEFEANQCDGCKAGLPVIDGIHRDNQAFGIACTKKIYNTMKFRDIKPFTRGGYEVNMPLTFLDKNIIEWETDPFYGLQINPDFQRGHVWKEHQQISFVEYFLRGGVSGRVIYFNKPSWQSSVEHGQYDDFVVVDGLQRLTALRRFLRGEIRVFGQLISEFDSLMMAEARDNLKLNINNLKTRKEVLTWYLEMNTGGVVHTDEEIERVKKLLETEK